MKDVLWCITFPHHCALILQCTFKKKFHIDICALKVEKKNCMTRQLIKTRQTRYRIRKCSYVIPITHTTLDLSLAIAPFKMITVFILKKKKYKITTLSLQINHLPFSAQPFRIARPQKKQWKTSLFTCGGLRHIMFRINGKILRIEEIAHLDAAIYQQRPKRNVFVTHLKIKLIWRQFRWR